MLKYYKRYFKEDFMFRNFLYKLAAFMQGRYGNDKLNIFLLCITAILYFINLFVRSPWIVLFILLPMAIYIFRSLSKNINKRVYENARFVSIFKAVTDFFKRQSYKIRDFKTHRYVKCPYCKSYLRLKKRTGHQTIHCPRCNEDFKKNILF